MGEWEPFVREVARHDYDLALRIQRWPLTELLIAYLEVAKEHMREDLRHKQLLYQVRVVWGGAKEQPPTIPDLLRK